MEKDCTRAPHARERATIRARMVKPGTVQHIVLIWYTGSGLDVSIRSRMRAYSASGAFSLHQRSTPGWASTDASPIINTFRNINTYAFMLNKINYVGSCARQQLRHVCMFLLIEYVLRSVNRARCTGEIPCEDGGSTSESKKGQPRKSTRTEEK